MSALARYRKSSSDRLRGMRFTREFPSIPDIGEVAATDPMMVLGKFGSTARRELARKRYVEYRGWVYVAIRAIATRASAQPVVVGKTVKAAEEGQRSIESRLAKDKRPGVLMEKHPGMDVELDPDHPANSLLANPNPIQNKSEFLLISIASLNTTGECYWIGGMNEETNRPEIWAVPTHWIEPRHDERLFSGYWLKPNEYEEPIPLEPDQVARIYLPDPSNIRLAHSPLSAMEPAIRTDNKIQREQEQSFDVGLFPQVAISIGKEPGPDGKERRPVLQGKQRRQLIRSVRTVWNNTVGKGDPAVLDGLIDGIHKLSLSNTEMGFDSSGKITKARIFQTLNVNPIVVGEITPSNRAQAVEAQKNFCDNAVNPPLSSFSEALTNWVGPWYDEPNSTEKTVIYLELCAPIDEDLRYRKWQTARANGDVSENEYRSHVLGLGEREEDDRRRLKIHDNPAAMANTTKLLADVKSGTVTPESATQVLMVFLGMTEEEALGLVDSIVVTAALDPAGEVDDGGMTGTEEELVRSLKSSVDAEGRREALKRYLKRRNVKSQGGVATVMARFFQSSAEESRKPIASIGGGCAVHEGGNEEPPTTS